MDFVIAQPAQAFVPVKGSKAAFPVHRIYCVGRNYAAHAIEMGGDPNRDPPFFFQKNPDNLVLDGSFPYPLPVVLGHEAAGVVEAVGAEMWWRQMSWEAFRLGEAKP